MWFVVNTKIPCHLITRLLFNSLLSLNFEKLFNNKPIVQMKQNFLRIHNIPDFFIFSEMFERRWKVDVMPPGTRWLVVCKSPNPSPVGGHFIFEESILTRIYIKIFYVYTQSFATKRYLLWLVQKYKNISRKNSF